MYTYRILRIRKFFVNIFMASDKSFLIIRHRKENLRKCSLRGLETRQDTTFLQYPHCVMAGLPPLDAYVLLDIDGDILTPDDPPHFLLIDATWRYATKMLTMLPSLQNCVRRRLPDTWRTAYPRCQNGCPDPQRGLASIEALYVASLIVGRHRPELLDGYYWKKAFLELNHSEIEAYMTRMGAP
jgi:pre-rRNA-processing protein TSR3